MLLAPFSTTAPHRTASFTSRIGVGGAAVGWFCLALAGCQATDDPPIESLWQTGAAADEAPAHLSPSQQRDLNRRAPILEPPKPANMPGEPPPPASGERFAPDRRALQR